MNIDENIHTHGFNIKKLSDLSRALLTIRQASKLEQAEMKMLIGMTQQQYQSIEAGANVTVTTLLRVLEGLEVDLVLIPKRQSSLAHPPVDLEALELVTVRENSLARKLAHLEDNE